MKTEVNDDVRPERPGERLDTPNVKITPVKGLFCVRVREFGGALVEDYQQGEPIADLATKLGVHRTTLDNLVKRLELSREDPDAVAPAVKDAIVASYRAGETRAVIGSRHRFSPKKVQRLLVAAGEPVRSRGPHGSQLTREQTRDLLGLYERGRAMGSIAEEFGVSYAYVRKQIMGAGVQLRARGGAR